MTTPVPTGQPGLGYGLGLAVIETPAGRLLGHDGAIPGFADIVFSTEDGRRQAGMMMNEEFATPAVSQAFSQVFMTLAMGLVDGAASGVASTSAALRAAVRAGAAPSISPSRRR
jgi:D-alanyl-D-alanine carboxypeptidase